MDERFLYCVIVLLDTECRDDACTIHSSLRTCIIPPQTIMFLMLHLHSCRCFYYYYLAGCTKFSHLPAPIWQLHYLLPPVTSVIPFFFHQSLFSHQSFNSFRPGEFRSTSLPSSQWTPFHSFFWQSSFFHSLSLFFFNLFSTFEIISSVNFRRAGKKKSRYENSLMKISLRSQMR